MILPMQPMQADDHIRMIMNSNYRISIACMQMTFELVMSFINKRGFWLDINPGEMHTITRFSMNRDDINQFYF